MIRQAVFFVMAVCGAAVGHAEIEQLRLSWRGDPSTTMVIGFGMKSGDSATLHYGPKDFGRDVDKYPEQEVHTTSLLEPTKRAAGQKPLVSHFFRLSGLKPNTAYYFVVRDSDSISRRYWFRTAPAGNEAFTFIAGGDSRNNPKARRNGNLIVSKLRPLFILFGGDYTGSGTPDEWRGWLNDWQKTISIDGRCYPLVVTHGNHENNDMTMVQKVFDCETEDIYYTRRFGKLLSVTALNSELNSEKFKRQSAWLAKELPTLNDVRWQCIAYHKPMRPHTRKKSEGDRFRTAYANWFHKHRIDLVVESDTHMVKRTYPIRPSSEKGAHESFIRDDATGTVYIGEGSWGAPRRPADDAKPWTMASDSFYQFKWINVTETDMQIQCIQFDNAEEVKPLAEGAGYFIPQGLKVWKPATGAILRLPFDANHPTFLAKPKPFAAIQEGWDWSYRTDGAVVNKDWTAVGYEAKNWPKLEAPLGYGEDAVVGELKKPVQTAYFRRNFAVPFKPKSATLQLLCDDGAVVYINGKEATRYNMAKGLVKHDTMAIERKEPEAWLKFAVSADLLTMGNNTIAVSVHQRGTNSSDLIFDAKLEVTK